MTAVEAVAPVTANAMRAALAEAADAMLTVSAMHRRCVPDGYLCVSMTSTRDTLETLWAPSNPNDAMVIVTSSADGIRGPDSYARVTV